MIWDYVFRCLGARRFKKLGIRRAGETAEEKTLEKTSATSAGRKRKTSVEKGPNEGRAP